MRPRRGAASEHAGSSAIQRWSASKRELPTSRDHWFGAIVDGLDDLGVIDPSQVSGGDREVCVTELSLDHDQRDPLARHLNRMRVSELMRREPATHLGSERGVVELLADAGCCARPASCRTAQDAEQSSHRQAGAQLEPGVEV